MMNEGEARTQDEQRGGGEFKGRRTAETKDIGRGKTQERAVLVAIMAGEVYDLRAQR